MSPPPAPERPRRRAVPVVVGVLLAVLVASTGVAAGPGPAGAQVPQRRVVVVGDSIILGAESPMVGAFRRSGWATTFDAEVNRSTLAGIEAVRRHGAELSDTLVVSLGANDAGNTATFRQRVAAVMAAAAGVPHVYWLTIREVRPYYTPANEVLRAAAAAYPNLDVIDWNAASAGSAGLTAGDGLHLTGSGAGALAFLVASTVVAAPPAATTPAAGPAPTTVPVTTAAPVAPTTAAPPTTTGAPETSAPAATTPSTTTSSTTASTAVAPTTAGSLRGVAMRVDEDGGAGWLGWSVGLGLLGVVAVLAASGVWIAVWSLLRTRGRAAPAARGGGSERSARARLRAARIAASREHHPAARTAAEAADRTPSTSSATGPES